MKFSPLTSYLGFSYFMNSKFIFVVYFFFPAEFKKKTTKMKFK